MWIEVILRQHKHLGITKLLNRLQTKFFLKTGTTKLVIMSLQEQKSSKKNIPTSERFKAPELLENGALQHRRILWQRCPRQVQAFGLDVLEDGKTLLFHCVPRWKSCESRVLVVFFGANWRHVILIF